MNSRPITVPTVAVVLVAAWLVACAPAAGGEPSDADSGTGATAPDGGDSAVDPLRDAAAAGTRDGGAAWLRPPGDGGGVGQDGRRAGCDWFAQDCTDPARTCLPSEQSPAGSCRVAGTARLGQACGAPSGVGCARGLLCAEAPRASPTCHEICDPTAAPGTEPPRDGGVSRWCRDGQRCVVLVGSYPPDFGVCATP